MKFKKGDIIKTKTKRYINVGKKSKPQYEEKEIEIIGMVFAIGHIQRYQSTSYKQIHVVTLKSTPEIGIVGESNIFPDFSCELLDAKIEINETILEN